MEKDKVQTIYETLIIPNHLKLLRTISKSLKFSVFNISDWSSTSLCWCICILCSLYRVSNFITNYVEKIVFGQQWKLESVSNLIWNLSFTNITDEIFQIRSNNDINIIPVEQISGQLNSIPKKMAHGYLNQKVVWSSSNLNIKGGIQLNLKHKF